MAGIEEVDSPVGHGYREYGYQHVEMVEARCAQQAEGAMKRQGVDDEGYQCPGLFRIPRPVLTPGDICPYRTGTYAESKEPFSGIEQSQGEFPQSLRVCGTTQSTYAYQEGEGQQSVGGHHQSYVH